MLVVSGCGEQPVKTVYKTEQTVVYIVPDSPKIVRPDLDINHLTPQEKQNIGILSKSLTISFAQLKAYTCKLETIVNKYQDLAKQSPSPVKPTAQLFPMNNFLFLLSIDQNTNSLIVDFNKNCGIQ